MEGGKIGASRTQEVCSTARACVVCRSLFHGQLRLAPPHEDDRKLTSLRGFDQCNQTTLVRSRTEEHNQHRALGHCRGHCRLFDRKDRRAHRRRSERPDECVPAVDVSRIARHDDCRCCFHAGDRASCAEYSADLTPLQHGSRASWRLRARRAADRSLLVAGPGRRKREVTTELPANPIRCSRARGAGSGHPAVKQCNRCRRSGTQLPANARTRCSPRWDAKLRRTRRRAHGPGRSPSRGVKWGFRSASCKCPPCQP